MRKLSVVCRMSLGLKLYCPFDALSLYRGGLYGRFDLISSNEGFVVHAYGTFGSCFLGCLLVFFAEWYLLQFMFTKIYFDSGFIPRTLYMGTQTYRLWAGIYFGVWLLSNNCQNTTDSHITITGFPSVIMDLVPSTSSWLLLPVLLLWRI